MKITNTLLSLIILLSLSSFGVIVKSVALKKYTVEKGAIPPEFGTENTTLICVLTGKKSRDKYLKKHIEKIYEGKYVLVLKEDLSSTTYANVDQFRYQFDFSQSYATTFTPNHTTNRTDIGTISASNYFIIDRKLEKKYNSDINSGFFGKLIKAYDTNLIHI